MSWRTSALGLFVGLLEGTTEGSGVGNADVGMAVCLRVGCVITAMNHKEEGIMGENWFVCSVSLVLCSMKKIQVKGIKKETHTYLSSRLIAWTLCRQH